MAHITKFIVVHNDGFTQSIVGNPMPNRKSALKEMGRLVFEEDYDANQLQIVQVPN